jgi:hypothetical protein
MAAAEAHPTSANYHRWRKRVKDLWLQIRLLGRRCEGGLRECERQLERLDGLLGDSHNVFLLEQLVAAEPVLPRAQTAQLLHRLRRLQLSLRDEALSQGRATLNERPDEFVRRVRRVWRRRVRQKGLRGSRLWQRAA